MIAQCLAGAFLAVCRDWIDQSCARRADELRANFTHVATGIIDGQIDWSSGS